MTIMFVIDDYGMQSSWCSIDTCLCPITQYVYFCRQGEHEWTLAIVSNIHTGHTYFDVGAEVVQFSLLGVLYGPLYLVCIVVESHHLRS